MNRIAILFACAALLASSSASAQVVLELAAPLGGTATVGVGETITLQINISNPDPLDVFGVAASVSEYDEDVLDFTSGESVPNYFNQVCVGAGSCFGGFSNLASPTLAESSIGANGSRVQIALSAGLSAISNDGSIDQGIDQVEGSSQFDLVFTGIAEGVTTVLIGTTYQGDGITLMGGAQAQATGDSITITVPEPGAVATSIVALGSVLGLAGMRRRI